MFQPVVPMGGYAGWAFLSRTLDKQQEAYDKAPAVLRETTYFEQNIGKVSTAADLMADRTLLRVALGAFGLDKDINSKAFIQKILEGGTLDQKSLANKLSDKRYLAFSKAFGFGDFSVPRTKLSDFGTEITSKYKQREFETAVGDQNANMRLALGLRRELGEVAGKSYNEDTKWFTVMGQPPLRKVFETAFGLPRSFGALDLDKQLETFKSRAESAFGDGGIAQFSDPKKQEDLIRLFLLRADMQAFNAGAARGEIALTLLQGASGGQTGLVL